MGRCLPPCVENGVDYCADPDGGVRIPDSGSEFDARQDGSDVVAVDTQDVRDGDTNDGFTVADVPCNPMQNEILCNGVCTNLTTSADHCGACENRCLAEHGTPACGRSGTGSITCIVQSCDRGFADCDSVVANGCETSVSDDAMNCGMCGNSCPAPMNGTKLCTAGVCGISCNAGFRAFNGTCLPEGTTPRPIAPLSLGDVSLRRPALRWVLPAAFDGATVELCRDRACMQRIETIRARGTSTRPTMALAPRTVVFWRLRGTNGMLDDSQWSPTWLFHVPAMDASAGVDTSTHPHLDLNGDGFDDVVVGAPLASPGGMMNAGEVRVYYGGVMGIGAVADRVLRGARGNDQFGSAVAAAGDVDGDGFGELIVGAWHATLAGGDLRAGAASIYRGGPMGISVMPTTLLIGAAARDEFGVSVASGGDLNGDGYADVVVGAWLASPGGSFGEGSASVYYGSAMGIANAPSRVLGGTNGDGFGYSLASAGDVNADGYSDLIVGASNADPGGRFNAGTASIFLGGMMGIANVPMTRIEGAAAGDAAGSSVASAGDVNNDGFSDVVVGTTTAFVGMPLGQGYVTLHHGSAGGISVVAARTLRGGGSEDHWGRVVTSAGDVNADGFSDVLIGSADVDVGGLVDAGRVSVFLGSVMGIPAAPARTIDGAASRDWLGYSAAGVGDVNQDGFDDIVIGVALADPGGRVDAGRANLHIGSVIGISSVPTAIIDGAVAGDGFGTSVARLTPRRSNASDALYCTLFRSTRRWQL